MPGEAYKCGLTKVFFRTGQMAMMEKVLNIDWATSRDGKPLGEWVGGRLKGFVVRRRWRRALAKVRTCLAVIKTFTETYQEIMKNKNAGSLTIQRVWRGGQGRMRWNQKWEEEQERKRQEAEEARKKAVEEARKRAEEEERIRKEAEEARKRLEEAQKSADAAAAKAAKEEAERLEKMQAEQAAAKAEAEAQQKKAEEERAAQEKAEAEARARMEAKKDEKEAVRAAASEEKEQAKTAVQQSNKAEMDLVATELLGIAKGSHIKIKNKEPSLEELAQTCHDELAKRAKDRIAATKEKSQAEFQRARASVTSKQARSSIISLQPEVTGYMAKTEKARRLMKVNELLNNGDLEDEKAEALTDEIFDCDPDGPFPDLPGLPGDAKSGQSRSGSVRGSIFVQREVRCQIPDGDGKLGMKVGVLTEDGCKMVLVLGVPKAPDGTPQRAEQGGIKLGDRLIFIHGIPVDPDNAIQQILEGPYPLDCKVLRGTKATGNIRERAQSEFAAQQTAARMKDLFDEFSEVDSGTGKDVMDSATLTRFCKECNLLNAKLTTSDVGLVFERVKVGKRKWVDFRGFEEACRHFAMKRQMPYQELMDSAAANFKEAVTEVEKQQGYLTKRPVKGRWSAKWQQRWFVLNKSCLSYFESHMAKQEKGSFPLSAESKVEKNAQPDPRSKRSHCFSVETLGDTLYVMATSGEDMEEWCARVADNIEELKNSVRGYLTKRAVNSGANWQNRWFVLDKNSLHYYADEKSTTVKGIIDLTPDTECEAYEGEEISGLEGDKSNCFCVSTKGEKDLYVQAQSDADMER